MDSALRFVQSHSLSPMEPTYPLLRQSTWVQVRQHGPAPATLDSKWCFCCNHLRNGRREQELLSRDSGFFPRCFRRKYQSIHFCYVLNCSVSSSHLRDPHPIVMTSSISSWGGILATATAMLFLGKNVTSATSVQENGSTATWHSAWWHSMDLHTIKTSFVEYISEDSFTFLLPV